jgi:hypothetical protein
VKQGLRPADALKGSHDVQRERDEPIVISVGQLALGLRPDELIRVLLFFPRTQVKRLRDEPPSERGPRASSSRWS